MVDQINKIGEYELIEIIGKGGMAIVYRAYQPSFDRYVAIKVLPGQHSEDPHFLKRFEHESMMIARLEHRAILPVYASGSHEGSPYIVMRLLEGGSLRRRLYHEPPDIIASAKIIRQIAEALDYAHSKGVVHRDLKPSNIMLDTNGDAYLTDFGIAKILGMPTLITQKGVVGTPSYMAPEQCQGKQATPASDIYGLGVIVYELLTGRLPFEADTPLAVMYMQVRDPIPSVQDADPGVSALFDTVIQKAMAKDPDDRYASAQDLATDFVKVARQAMREARAREQIDTAEAAKVDKALRRERLRQINWLAWGAATAVLAAVITGAMLIPRIFVQLNSDGVSGLPSETGTQIAEDTPLPEITTGVLIEPSPISIEPGNTALLPTSTIQAMLSLSDIRDASFLPGALYFTQGTGEQAEIMVMDSLGENRRPLTSNNVYDGEPDWSAQQNRVAFETLRAGNFDIVIMNSDGTDIRQITAGEQPERLPDWSPDGELIAYEAGSGALSEIMVASVNDGTAEYLTTNSSGDRSPQFAPDGSLITFMTDRRGKWEIAVMAYPAGESTIRIFDCPAVACRFPAWSPDGKKIAFHTLDVDGTADSIWLLDAVSGEPTLLVQAGQNSRPAWSSDGTTLFFNHNVNGISKIYRYDISQGTIFELESPAAGDYAMDWANP